MDWGIGAQASSGWESSEGPAVSSWNDEGTPAGGGSWPQDEALEPAQASVSGSGFDHNHNQDTTESDDRGCFNCGETGHMKSDCPNPRVEREFTGKCNLCQRDGHCARDCPEKPPVLCRNCYEEGHVAANCKAPRKIDRTNIETVDATVAWTLIKEGVAARDPDFEKSLRNQSIGLYLIALEKPDLLPTLTLMDLQGHCDKKYNVSYRFSDKAARPRERTLFPKDKDENLARLNDAGEPVENGKRRCYNCNTYGHSSSSCQEMKVEREQIVIKCTNCDAVGHRMRDCPEERVDKFARERGSGGAEDVDCRKCGEIGHIARDCPQGGGGGRGGGKGSLECFKCGEAGHIARDCPRGQDGVNSGGGHDAFDLAARPSHSTPSFDNNGSGQDDAQWNSAASGGNDGAWAKGDSSAIPDW